MAIDLKQFVDINIVPHATTNAKGTRNAVLFTSEGSSVTPIIINNLNDVTTKLIEMTNTSKFATVFVEHGGTNLKVICGKATLSKTDIASLDTSDVVVAYYSATGTNTLVAAAKAYEADSSVYGVNEKIFVSAGTANASADTFKGVTNFAYKYSTVVGAEMTMAAYLSKIDVYSIDSVKDYAFTKELIAAADDSAFTSELQSANYNIDLTLANAVRNVGGNCTDGKDLVNAYVRIVLHQTLTDKLVDLLTQKIRGTAGVSKIYSTISKELQNYLTCGYLTTDKIWTDDDYKVTVDNQTYTIIEKGTALQNGDLIKILPMSSLTDAQKAKHSAPYIYVVIADQYGIRFITVNGEVI